MKHIRYTLWGVVTIVAIAFIAMNLPQGNNDTKPTYMPPAGYNKGHHFTLTGHNGAPFNSDVEIADGAYALIFFGFTHCPAICPTELQKFAVAMDSLPQKTAAKITPLFITIDPDRDNVEALNTYVPQFHPSIIGLTGNQDAIKTTLRNWKVYAAKVNDPQYTEYTMDHSTYSYLVDSDMNILALFRLADNSDKITGAIQKIVP